MLNSSHCNATETSNVKKQSQTHSDKQRNTGDQQRKQQTGQIRTASQVKHAKLNTQSKVTQVRQTTLNK
jgi:hypothetical protein